MAHGEPGEPQTEDRPGSFLGLLHSGVQRVLAASWNLHSALQAITDPQTARQIEGAIAQLDLLVRDAGRSALRAEPAPSPVFEDFLYPVEAANLDLSGRITSVNAAWVQFCIDNGGDPAVCGVGASYLDACAAADDPVSRRVAAAIRSAIGGDLIPPQSIFLRCDSSSEQRWFDFAAYPILDHEGTPQGAMVTLWRVDPSSLGGSDDDLLSEALSLLIGARARIDAVWSQTDSGPMSVHALQVDEASQAVHRAIIAIESVAVPADEVGTDPARSPSSC